MARIRLLSIPPGGVVIKSLSLGSGLVGSNGSALILDAIIENNTLEGMNFSTGASLFIAGGAGALTVKDNGQNGVVFSTYAIASALGPIESTGHLDYDIKCDDTAVFGFSGPTNFGTIDPNCAL